MSTSELPTTREVTLAELVAAVVQWCDRTDPALLTGADAAAGAEQVATMLRRLSTKEAALAARATECHAFSPRFGSGEAWLAGLNGTSQTQAKRALDTIRRLADCPTAQAAFDAGELSVDEADLVTAAAVVNPEAEGRLVERARQHVHADTRTAADRARHAVFSREQEQARLARMRKLRRVRELTDSDQLSWIDAHLLPEAWAMVRPVLDAYTDLEFHAARQAGRREPLDAYRADGLIAALHAAGTYLTNPPHPPSPGGDGPGGASRRSGGPDRAGGAGGGSGGSATAEPPPTASPTTLFDHHAERPQPIEPAEPTGRTNPTELAESSRLADPTPQTELTDQRDATCSPDSTADTDVSDFTRVATATAPGTTERSGLVEASDVAGSAPATAADGPGMPDGGIGVVNTSAAFGSREPPAAGQRQEGRLAVLEPSAESAGGAPPGRRRKPAEVVVLVDAIALRRGYATPSETCEIAGSATPVSIDWITDRLPTAAVDVLVHDRIDIRAHTIVHRRRRPPGPDLPADRRPTIVVLIDAPTLVDPHQADPDQPDPDPGATIRLHGTDLHLSIERLRRLVPTDIAQAVERDLLDIRTYRSTTRHTPRPVRLAIAARDRRCTVPGCRRRQRLERDHLHDHAKGGPATTGNLHGLCDLHHDDKTYRDAHVITTPTERLWYPSPPTNDHTESPDTTDPSVPWRAPLGEHLNPWDLTHLPDPSSAADVLSPR